MLFKFDHLHASNGSKNGNFDTTFQVETQGLVGYQNFLEWKFNGSFES